MNRTIAIIGIFLAGLSTQADLTNQITLTGPGSVAITISGTDTNHLYGLYHTPDLRLEPVLTQSFLGSTGPVQLIASSTNQTLFYRTRQEAGFVVWADIVSSPRFTDCFGDVLGLANYRPATGFGWAKDINSVAAVITDTFRSDTLIQYVTSFGQSGCGTNTVTIPSFNGELRFTIYFRDNLPSGTYPMRLIGFVQ